MILQELFQSEAIKWKWSVKGFSKWVATFDVDVPEKLRTKQLPKKLVYYVDFIHSYVNEISHVAVDEEACRKIFSSGEEGEKPIWKFNFHTRGYDQFPIYNLTKTGNPIAIFNTVIKIVFDFDKQKKPKGYYFYGFDEKQGRFYKFLIDKFLKNTDLKSLPTKEPGYFILYRETP